MMDDEIAPDGVPRRDDRWLDEEFFPLGRPSKAKRRVRPRRWFGPLLKWLRRLTADIRPPKK